MQVTETLSEGLKRAFKVVLPVEDLAKKLDDELAEMKDKVRIPGFRPGKVPVAHLRKVYGKSVMADVLQKAVNDANQKIIQENELRLASEPKVDVDGGETGVEKAIRAEGDLAFTVNLEILPKVELRPFDSISLERQVFPVPDDEVEETINRLATESRPFEAKEGVAGEGDRVVIDFVGRIDGETFEGGSGTDMNVVIGSNTFLPGFEEQLKGVAAGESRVLKVKFPEEYPGAPHLAGKDAEFDVTAKSIEAPGELTVDDEFAKKFGVQSLEELRTAIRADMQKQYDAASRQKLKRALLDQLDKAYRFELPESLVEQEFNGIWEQSESERQQAGKTFEELDTSEEKARADLRGIAERRVRLGLLMAQVGEEAKVEVSEQELTAAIVERVREIGRQYPGQERAAWEFFQKNEQAVAQVRAPLFEEKVVDIIVSQASVTEKPVTREELLRPEPEDDVATAKDGDGN